MNRDDIAKFIKEQRAKVGMTQQDLAEILCTSRENISKWERGLAIPNTEYLRPLCKALQVPITDLLAGKISSSEEDASNIIFDIMDRNQRIRKRFFRIFLTTIIIAIFSFLAYYFIDNYNSIKIYTIDKDQDKYILDNSLLLILKKKGYFIFNGLTTPDDEELQNIKMYYYDDNNNQITIYNSNKLHNVIKIEFELSKLKEIINNTYMEITTNKDTSTVKLKIKKKYSNDELFDDIENKKDIALSTDFYFDNFSFPPLKDFTYNEKENVYTYKKEKIVIEYYSKTKKTALFANRNNKEDIITFLDNTFLLYNYNVDSKNEIYCYYNYRDYKIVKGDCANYVNNIDNLVKKYLQFIA